MLAGAVGKTKFCVVTVRVVGAGCTGCSTSVGGWNLCQEVKACFDIIRSHAEARAVLLSGVYAVDMAGDFAFILSVMRIRMYFPVKVKYVCRKKRRFRSLE